MKIAEAEGSTFFEKIHGYGPTHHTISQLVGPMQDSEETGEGCEPESVSVIGNWQEEVMNRFINKTNQR